MLLNLLRTIIDFAVLVARLTTEEFVDEQRMVLIDQFMRLQEFNAAFEFDLHDLLMILITVQVDLPEDLLRAASVYANTHSPASASREVAKLLALELYREGSVSLGRALEDLEQDRKFIERLPS